MTKHKDEKEKNLEFLGDIAGAKALKNIIEDGDFGLLASFSRDIDKHLSGNPDLEQPRIKRMRKAVEVVDNFNNQGKSNPEESLEVK